MIYVKINGNNENLENDNLLSYLLSKNIDVSKVVVEINEEIVNRDEVDKIVLKDNDKIEIIRFIGGG